MRGQRAATPRARHANAELAERRHVPLLLEIPQPRDAQSDLLLLGHPRRARKQRDELRTPPDPPRVDVLRRRERSRLLCALRAHAPPEERENADEDEDASEHHQQDLPPRERTTSAGVRHRWRVDARDGGQRNWDGGARHLRDGDEFREAHPQSGYNGRRIPAAVRWRT